MRDLIKHECLTPCKGEVIAMAESIYKGNNGAAAVMFYGSGLWKELADDTVMDFYLLVDSFKAASSPLSHRFWGAILPPNVYYKEISHDGKTLRCKYAVMTVKQFERAANGWSVAPSIWARFSQPCRLVWARGKHRENKVIDSLAMAVETFHRRSIPLLQGTVTPQEIWTTGMADTYGSELRSESKARQNSIYDASPTRFDKCTELFAQNNPKLLRKEDNNKFAIQSSSKQHLFKKLNTPIRRLSGKLVTLLRLIKAPLTFDGAVDYIIWKIERHTGERIEATDFQRRHPLIGGWPLLYKVLTRKIVG